MYHAGGIGGILFLAGWIWMMIIAFQDHIGWGLLVLLLPGIGGIVYGAMRWPGTKIPLILLVIGVLVGGGGYFGHWHHF